MSCTKRAVDYMKNRMVKAAIKILIQKFGLEIINDTIAALLTEEAEAKNEIMYDELSEMYDMINRNMRLYKFKKTKA